MLTTMSKEIKKTETEIPQIKQFRVNKALQNPPLSKFELLELFNINVKLAVQSYLSETYWPGTVDLT